MAPTILSRCQSFAAFTERWLELDHSFACSTAEHPILHTAVAPACHHLTMRRFGMAAGLVLLLALGLSAPSPGAGMDIAHALRPIRQEGERKGCLTLLASLMKSRLREVSVGGLSIVGAASASSCARFSASLSDVCNFFWRHSSLVLSQHARLGSLCHTSASTLQHGR